MNKQIPKISVLMSVYNGSRYLRESVESILNQTFTDFEFVIINDASTDNTWEILAEYAKKDARIILIQNQENLGLTKSLNKGLKIVKAEYIARQDADDVSLPERLAKQVSLLDRYPNIALVSCDIEYVDFEGYLIGKDQNVCSPELVGWYLLFYNRVAGHSQVIFRRELVINLNGYCERYRYSQDYELWCRIIKVSQIYILPEVLLKQRRHKKSISFAKASEQEVYLLTQVKHNIGQLIEREITIEEAKYLNKFWMKNWDILSFQTRQKAKIIHNITKEIFHASLQKNVFGREISYQLRIIIGNQFITWLPFLNNQLLAKIFVFFYALHWYPLGVLKYVYRGIKNLLSRTFVRFFFKENIKFNT
ncbi:hypothetical protein NUACC21_82280 [Scytonema sp. NUACC21]